MKSARIATAVGCVAILCSSACQGPPSVEASWELEFASPAGRDESAVIDAIIWQGGCDAGAELYRMEVGGEEEPAAPPSLAAGTYGFGGEARNAACEPIARGCKELRLPMAGERRIRVQLRPNRGAAACPPGLCRLGRCGGAGADGGAPPHVRNGSDAGSSQGRDAGRSEPGDAGRGTSPPADGGAGSHDSGAAGDGGTRPPDAGTGSNDPEPPCRQGHCYRFESNGQSWPSAEAACVAWGGHLVTVDDADEEAWILERWGPTLDLWIGLNDRHAEGEWVWADGSDPEFLHWAPGSPGGGGNDQDCVAFRSDRFGWDDRNCRQGKVSLCERPATGTSM